MGIFGIVLVLIVVVLFFVVPSYLRKSRNKKQQYVSELSYLVGEKGYVVSHIGPERTGMVRVGSDIWSARSDVATGDIEPGQWVDIQAARKSLLIVRPKQVHNG